MPPFQDGLFLGKTRPYKAGDIYLLLKKTESSFPLDSPYNWSLPSDPPPPPSPSHPKLDKGQETPRRDKCMCLQIMQIK